MNQTFGIIVDFILIAAAITAVQTVDAKANSQTSSLKQGIANDNIEIYGVRWRLGDAWGLQQDRNSELFILQFNSESFLNGEIYVKFQNLSFSCSQQQISPTDFSTFLHTCRINEPLHAPYDYQIVLRETVIGGQESDPHVQPSTLETLFRGKLRLEGLGGSILVLGDIIFDESAGFLCQIADVVHNQNVSMVILGNFYPEINAQNYAKILRFLQPLTSQLIVFPASQIWNPPSPFQALTFPFSLSWSSREYSVFSFPNLNLTMFLINPDPTIPEISLLFSQTQKERLSDDLILVVSPFQKLHSGLFQQIGTNVFVSPERNSGFTANNYCNNEPISKESDMKKCPLLIREGRADLPGKVQDFGLLQITSEPEYKTFTFTHFAQCSPSHSLQFDYNPTKQAQSDDDSATFRQTVRRITLAIEYIVIFGLAAFLLFTLLSLRRQSRQPQPSEAAHVELVEQIVAGSQPAQT